MFQISVELSVHSSTSNVPRSFYRPKPAGYCLIYSRYQNGSLEHNGKLALTKELEPNEMRLCLKGN